MNINSEYFHWATARALLLDRAQSEELLGKVESRRNVGLISDKELLSLRGVGRTGVSRLASLLESIDVFIVW